MSFHISRTIWATTLGLALAAAAVSTSQGPAATPRQAPKRAVTDPGVITTGQAITPAGVQSTFDGRVYGVAFGASDEEIWVLTGRGRTTPEVLRLDWLANTVRGRWNVAGTPALQGLTFDPSRKGPLVGLTRHM